LWNTALEAVVHVKAVVAVPLWPRARLPVLVKLVLCFLLHLNMYAGKRVRSESNQHMLTVLLELNVSSTEEFQCLLQQLRVLPSRKAQL
jgi:hypothetical protein